MICSLLFILNFTLFKTDLVGLLLKHFGSIASFVGIEICWNFCVKRLRNK